jgi:hypothetical protein
MTLAGLFSTSARSGTRIRTALLGLLLVVAMPLILSFSSAVDPMTGQFMACSRKQIQVIRQTVRLHSLTIVQGCTLLAPTGHSLTLTVNGVETGQALTATGGTVTRVLPGVSHGDVVLTVTQANPVPWQNLTFPFRQSLYIDNTGVVDAKSVLARVAGGQITNTEAQNINITSCGEAFNGVYVTNGAYTLLKPVIALTSS